MKVILHKGFYYLSHSFRKEGDTVNRQRYLGKEIPKNIDQVKEEFLQKCLKEGAFKKLQSIQKNFKEEWKRLPESIKKRG